MESNQDISEAQQDPLEVEDRHKKKKKHHHHHSHSSHPNNHSYDTHRSRRHSHHRLRHRHLTGEAGLDEDDEEHDDVDQQRHQTAPHDAGYGHDSNNDNNNNNINDDDNESSSKIIKPSTAALAATTSAAAAAAAAASAEKHREDGLSSLTIAAAAAATPQPRPAEGGNERRLQTYGFNSEGSESAPPSLPPADIWPNEPNRGRGEERKTAKILDAAGERSEGRPAKGKADAAAAAAATTTTTTTATAGHRRGLEASEILQTAAATVAVAAATTTTTIATTTTTTPSSRCISSSAEAKRQEVDEVADFLARASKEPNLIAALSTLPDLELKALSKLSAKLDRLLSPGGLHDVEERSSRDADKDPTGLYVQVGGLPPDEVEPSSWLLAAQSNTTINNNDHTLGVSHGRAKGKTAASAAEAASAAVRILAAHSEDNGQEGSHELGVQRHHAILETHSEPDDDDDDDDESRKDVRLNISNEVEHLTSSFVLAHTTMKQAVAARHSRVSELWHVGFDTGRVMTLGRQRCPKPILQFLCQEYLVGESEAGVAVHVMRSGDCSQSSSVRFATEESSAKSGKHFEHAEGVLDFESGQRIAKIKVLIKEDADWSVNLHFRLRLLEESLENAVLGQHSNFVRVFILNDDPFPNAKGAKAFENAQDHHLRIGAAWGLFWRYLQMNWQNPIVRKGSIKTLLTDQVHNLYFLLVICLDMILVDKVLTATNAGTAMGQLWILCLLRVLPYALLHVLDWRTNFWRVGGESRKILQAALFRRLIFFDDSKLVEYKVGDLSSLIMRDSCELAADGYMAALSLPRQFGQVFWLCFFPFIETNVDDDRSISVSEVCIYLIPLLCYPMILMPFLMFRYPAMSAAIQKRNEAQNKLLTWIQECTSVCKLVQDYHKQGWAINRMEALIGQQNQVLVRRSEVASNNKYFANWVTMMAVVFYIMYGGRQVVLGNISTGTFLATLKIYQRGGDACLAIYGLWLRMEQVLPALQTITRLLNTPSELLDKEKQMKRRTEESLYRCKLGADLDDLPFVVETPCPMRTIINRSERATQWSMVPQQDRQLTFKQGNLVVLTGSQASGKAKMLELLSAMVFPLDPQHAYVPPHLRIVHVSFTPMLLSGTLMDNLVFGVPMFGDMAHAENAAVRICERLCMSKHTLDMVESKQSYENWNLILSYSQAFLLNLARALVTDPEVICVDLPLHPLEPSVAEQVLLTLRAFVDERGLERDVLSPHSNRPRRPRTCILSSWPGGSNGGSFIPRSILDHADAVFYMEEGAARMVYSGEQRTFLQHSSESCDRHENHHH